MDENNVINLESEIEALDNLQAGTEEKERQSQVVLNLATAKANMKKADNEVEIKKIDRKGFVVGAAVTGGLAFAGVVFKEVLKFITNGKIVRGEENYEVYNSKALDNR